MSGRKRQLIYYLGRSDTDYGICVSQRKEREVKKVNVRSSVSGRKRQLRICEDEAEAYIGYA